MRTLIILFLTIISLYQTIKAQNEIYYDFDFPYYGLKGNIESVTDTIFEKSTNGNMYIKHIIHCQFNNSGILVSRSLHSHNGRLIQQTSVTQDTKGKIVALTTTNYSSGRATNTTHRLISSIGNREEWLITDKNGKTYTNRIEYDGGTKSIYSKKNGVDEIIISSFDLRSRVREVKEMRNSLVYRWYAMTIDADGFPFTLKIFYENTNKTSKTTVYNYLKDHQNNWVEQYATSNNAVIGIVKRKIQYRW